MPLKVKKGQYDSIEIPNNGIQDPVLDTEILIKQKSMTLPGEYLGRLVLGIEDERVKVFGATIY